MIGPFSFFNAEDVFLSFGGPLSLEKLSLGCAFDVSDLKRTDGAKRRTVAEGMGRVMPEEGSLDEIAKRHLKAIMREEF